MRLKKFAALLATLAIAACATPGTKIPGEKVSSIYKTQRVNWKGDNAFVELRYLVKEVDGKIAVCGAYREGENGNGLYSEFTDQVADAARVKMRGNIVAHGMRYFAFHVGAASLYGKTANCVVTQHVWAAGMKSSDAQMDFSKLNFRGT